MQLTLAALKRRLAALESGYVIAAAAQTAPKHSNAPVAHCSAPPGRPKPSESTQPPTVPPSRIPQQAARSTSNTPLAVPLAWDLPFTDGKVPCFECALELPDSLVAHVVGHQGQGLKQAHDLSGSQLAVFSVALVVFGKRIAKKCVHLLQKQRFGNAALAIAALAPSREPTLSTPKPYSQSAPPPPPRASVCDPTPDFSELSDWDTPPSVPTPAASSLPAGSPIALSTPTPALSSPKVIDYAHGHYAQGTFEAPPCGTNTA
ncbi:hypothetical protein C0992_010214 [Termitomyces sp. T32_za158]|nr:hypothetical protein C0992_010214 [Termitomyces sp. T32_za158]